MTLELVVGRVTRVVLPLPQDSDTGPLVCEHADLYALYYRKVRRNRKNEIPTCPTTLCKGFYSWDYDGLANTVRGSFVE